MSVLDFCSKVISILHSSLPFSPSTSSSPPRLTEFVSFISLFCPCVSVFSQVEPSVCFTFSLHLFLFISVTHSFLLPLFPRRTHQLSILISICDCFATFFFCLSVQIVLFACILSSLTYPLYVTL